MSDSEIREGLQYLSGDELAQLQNAVMLARDVDPLSAGYAMQLISQEIHTRQTEGIGRKAGRFFKRHGETIGAIAVGALLGTWVGD